ncbi:olfactory receptor 2T1-like [Tachyglossus aculeatus]|uniref:olfactory receptor 2T1-like n=1 Tax=Tachyglossus aculeatus TaxID=9261 RepID=UPI0018F2F2BF|nr:olfactory receptor 2T1-like [Tachyglossus aculeatus]
MEGGNATSSTDFILLGLFGPGESSGLVFSLLCGVFLTAVASNSVLISLVWADPRLRTPMYFLLGHLSLIDVLYISTTVPKMLADFPPGRATISLPGCAAQHFAYLTLAGAEFYLLGLMAYDRYVAVCHPLRYPALVTRKACLAIVAVSWLAGGVDSCLLTPITMSHSFCGSRRIDHFFCEAPAVLRLACADTTLYETAMYFCCVTMLLVPFSVVLASYSRILFAVYRLGSAEGGRKALATCSSHVTVVTLFYGAAMYTYMLPHSYHTPALDKLFSAFYTILTPMLNPLIYSLRNKDVARALRRALGRYAASGKPSVDAF